MWCVETMTGFLDLELDRTALRPISSAVFIYIIIPISRAASQSRIHIGLGVRARSVGEDFLTDRIMKRLLLLLLVCRRRLSTNEWTRKD